MSASARPKRRKSDWKKPKKIGAAEAANITRAKNVELADAAGGKLEDGDERPKSGRRVATGKRVPRSMEREGDGLDGAARGMVGKGRKDGGSSHGRSRPRMFEVDRKMAKGRFRSFDDFRQVNLQAAKQIICSFRVYQWLKVGPSVVKVS